MSEYYKQFMMDYSIIILLCLFLTVYIIINYKIISNGNIYNGNVPKTIIITGIIFLLLFVFVSWDNENFDDQIPIIPKYNIVNNINNDNLKQLHIANNSIINNDPKKINYKIINKNNVVSHNSDNENFNIFIPQKNKVKYGIKF
jgi:hypothetical protein